MWQQCLDTEFLRRMEDGTLDEACFKGYIVEDSLYLREYAKVFAWGMTKARTMETLRNYYSLLGFVQESEDVTRLHYLEQFGLSEADLQALPLRPENRAYVDCMINAAKNGEGEAECIMACLPCMLSYGWIFQKMLDRSPAVRDTLYGPLVQDYAGPGYADACRAWAAYAERCAPACRRSAQPAAAPSSTTARCMSCISGKCRPSLARISDFFCIYGCCAAPGTPGGRRPFICGCNLRHGFL